MSGNKSSSFERGKKFSNKADIAFNEEKFQESEDFHRQAFLAYQHALSETKDPLMTPCIKQLIKYHRIRSNSPVVPPQSSLFNSSPYLPPHTTGTTTTSVESFCSPISSVKETRTFSNEFPLSVKVAKEVLKKFEATYKKASTPSPPPPPLPATTKTPTSNKTEEEFYMVSTADLDKPVADIPKPKKLPAREEIVALQEKLSLAIKEMEEIQAEEVAEMKCWEEELEREKEARLFAEIRLNDFQQRKSESD